jgi:preprotein translocase subunit SecY
LVLLAIVVIIIATVLSIIFVELGERRVPVFMLAR